VFFYLKILLLKKINSRGVGRDKLSKKLVDIFLLLTMYSKKSKSIILLLSVFGFLWMTNRNIVEEGEN